jgi:hypothetical protein
MTAILMSEREHHYRGLLAEFAASGKTIKAFSEERGIPRNRLSWWRNQLKWKDAALGTGQSSKLLPVRVSSPPSALPSSPAAPVPTNAMLEVVVKSGRVLRAPVDMDPTKLVALVAALEGTC